MADRDPMWWWRKTHVPWVPDQNDLAGLRADMARATARDLNTLQLVDGRWEPSEPIPPQGVVAKVEAWLRHHRFFPRLANALAAFDERGLGK